MDAGAGNLVACAIGIGDVIVRGGNRCGLPALACDGGNGRAEFCRLGQCSGWRIQSPRQATELKQREGPSEKSRRPLQNETPMRRRRTQDQVSGLGGVHVENVSHMTGRADAELH